MNKRKKLIIDTKNMTLTQEDNNLNIFAKKYWKLMLKKYHQGKGL